MRKSIVVLINIGFWICFFFILTTMVGILFGESQDILYIKRVVKMLFGFIVIPSILSFYSFYFLLFPKYLVHKKVLLLFVYGFILPLISAICGYLVLAFVLNINVSIICGMPPSLGILFSSSISLTCGIIALVMKGFISWFKEIKLREELKQKKHEIELALIKSKLDPHFLFNTINNIDILILKNANKASDYLNKLSDIIRFMLFETKTNKILLSKEIEYIEKYIELQKIRTNNYNYINFQIIGNQDNKTIAPMVFIPFIENAFKHTTNKKLDNAITVNIYIDDKIIKLECINKLDASRKLEQESNGLGNKLIKKRLKLLYPDRHTLTIASQENLYSVYLTISHEKI